MAVRKSIRLRTFLAGQGSLKRAFTGGKLKIYSGTQPATPDLAPTGTLLATLSQEAGAVTEEVLSRGSVTLATGAAGSVDQIAVNSVNLLLAAVPYNTSLSQTAADVVTAINAHETYPDYRAIQSGAKIIIEAQPGTGTGPNGYTVVTTITTMTKTDVNMGTEQAGVAQANGVLFGAASAGALAIDATWQGDGVANGTAGWARLEGSIADDDSDDTTTNNFLRMDFAVATTGSDINLVSTTVAIGAPVSITGGSISIPM